MALRIVDYSRDLPKLNDELAKVAKDRDKLVELEQLIRRMLKEYPLKKVAP